MSRSAAPVSAALEAWRSACAVAGPLPPYGLDRFAVLRFAAGVALAVAPTLRAAGASVPAPAPRLFRIGAALNDAAASAPRGAVARLGFARMIRAARLRFAARSAAPASARAMRLRARALLLEVAR